MIIPNSITITTSCYFTTHFKLSVLRFIIIHTQHTSNIYFITIVKRYISGTTGSNPIAYTSYVYNNGDWQACDGNYSASNVFFKENITVTQTVGNISTSNNTPQESPCAGKNIKELFEILYATSSLSKDIYMSFFPEV